jgi:hypothetical protein
MLSIRESLIFEGENPDFLSEGAGKGRLSAMYPMYMFESIRKNVFICIFRQGCFEMRPCFTILQTKVLEDLH